MTTPQLDGIHHVKLPVRDLDRSRDWYASRLGYQPAVEFVEQGALMGIAMRHPNGGPTFALRLDPARAEAAAGFDYFSIGVPSKDAIEELAARLTALGEPHAGVHMATNGWILPALHDPDGHEVRFYTTTHHSDVPSEGVLRIENPRETAEARERTLQHSEAGTQTSR
jgi:catechol 2,3-dioxygenase-like lactoylglutathione lyase family enzyme